MKYPKCKKDFETGVKAAYKLGFKEGEQQLKETIVKIKKVHKELFKELLRLDYARPTGFAGCVAIPKRMVRKIINFYAEQGNEYMPKKLQALIRSQCGIEGELLETGMEPDNGKKQTPIGFSGYVAVPKRTVRKIIKLYEEQGNEYMMKKLEALIKSQCGIEGELLETGKEPGNGKKEAG